jgi:hypothetical protein
VSGRGAGTRHKAAMKANFAPFNRTIFLRAYFT